MATTWGTQPRGLSLRAHFGGAKHADALTTHYFGLYVGNPFAGGAEATIGVNNYGRATVTNGSAMYGTPALGDTLLVSHADLVWPAATGAWTGTFDWWGINTASTAGTLWYAGMLPSPAVVTTSGDQPRILAGGLLIAQA